MDIDCSVFIQCVVQWICPSVSEEPAVYLLRVVVLQFYEKCVSVLLCFLLLTFYYFVILSLSQLCVSFKFACYPTTILLPFFPFLLSTSNCSKAAVIEIVILTAVNIILYCCVCSLVTGGYLHLGGTAASMSLKDEIVCSYESDQATGVMTQSLQSGLCV